RLLSQAYRLNNHHGRAVLKKCWLETEAIGSEGLIALSGGISGEITRYLLLADIVAAEAAARDWARLFPDRFYLEIQRCGQPNEETWVRATLHLASRLELPVVATHPVQFMQPDDYKAHDARVCIAQGYVL